MAADILGLEYVYCFSSQFSQKVYLLRVVKDFCSEARASPLFRSIRDQSRELRPDGLLRKDKGTRVPGSPSARAMARPMPRVAPMTRAVLLELSVIAVV